MKKIFILLCCLLLTGIYISCVSKPDDYLERRMSETKNGGGQTAAKLGGDTLTAPAIDTAAIRKKAREEYEKLNKERQDNYESTIAGSASDTGNETDALKILKEKNVDDIIKDKQFMKTIEKKK